MGENRKKGNPLKILLLYHSAALDPSRRIFEALAERNEVRLRVLGPRRGYNPARNMVLEIAKPYYGRYDLVSGHVYKAMKNFSGPYLTGLLREILFFRPDVIHVFNEAYSLVNVQALIYRNFFLPTAKCYCLGVENIIKKEPVNRKSGWKRNFVHKHCNGAACWSESAKNALREASFPEDKLKVTYWGVPMDQFFPSRNEALRLQLGISDKFLVGYIGRFRPEKGILTLFLALRLLPENIHCLCIGADGEWRDFFLAKIKKFGLDDRVHLIPRVPDEEVPGYMNAMDVLVLPSETTSWWKEQFGRVLPEAMACGLPVIGSDSGAIPEVVGDTGLVFAERDYKALAEAIGKLFANPKLCKLLGEKGIERVHTHFGCDAFAAKLLNLYKHAE